MMKCPLCGKPVEDGAAFCPYCGMKLEPEAPSSTGFPQSGHFIIILLL